MSSVILHVAYGFVLDLAATLFTPETAKFIHFWMNYPFNKSYLLMEDFIRRWPPRFTCVFSGSRDSSVFRS